MKRIIITLTFIILALLPADAQKAVDSTPPVATITPTAEAALEWASLKVLAQEKRLAAERLATEAREIEQAAAGVVQRIAQDMKIDLSKYDPMIDLKTGRLYFQLKAQEK